MAFSETLEYGRVAESYIARWLRKERGCIVMPVYEIEKSGGEGPQKGPQVFTPDASLIAPDMLVINPQKKPVFIEAKHKTNFTWFRKSEKWQTGIDKKHWKDYLRVADVTKFNLWLLFLHNCEIPSYADRQNGCPVRCPVGLFGNDIHYLKNRIDHPTPPHDPKNPKTKGHGKSGMVYWNYEDLIKIASLEEVYSVSNHQGIAEDSGSTYWTGEMSAS